MKQPLEGNLTQRSVWWAMEFTKLLAADAKLREQIPDGASICVMPAEDPEVGEYNAGLALRKKTGAEAVVFVRLERREDGYRVLPYLPREALLR